MIVRLHFAWTGIERAGSVLEIAGVIEVIFYNEQGAEDSGVTNACSRDQISSPLTCPASEFEHGLTRA